MNNPDLVRRNCPRVEQCLSVTRVCRDPAGTFEHQSFYNEIVRLVIRQATNLTTVSDYSVWPLMFD